MKLVYTFFLVFFLFFFFSWTNSISFCCRRIAVCSASLIWSTQIVPSRSFNANSIQPTINYTRYCNRNNNFTFFNIYTKNTQIDLGMVCCGWYGWCGRCDIGMSTSMGMGTNMNYGVWIRCDAFGGVCVCMWVYVFECVCVCVCSVVLKLPDSHIGNPVLDSFFGKR